MSRAKKEGKARSGSSSGKGKKEGSSGRTRYFMIKAPEDSLRMAMEWGMWTSQRANDAKFKGAYEGGAVVLIFSALKSGAFQGHCKMMCPPGGVTRKDAPPWKGANHMSRELQGQGRAASL